MPDLNDKLYTARQVRELDNSAIHEFGIAGYELMKRAGRAVVDDALARYPTAKRWLVMCGPGNNGGDGYVVAALASEAGIDVSLCSLVAAERLKGDAALAHADWQAAGGRVLIWPLQADRQYDLGQYDLALDALLGTGIDRDVSGEYRRAIEFLNGLGCPKIAIDIPSGLNADNGNVMAVAVQAHSTVTLVGRKRGMYTADGADYCGDISFADLSIPAACAAAIADHGQLVTADYLRGRLHPRKRNSHKGSYGHVLGVGGIAGMSGAIRLCGEAALRSGAGRVTLATDPQHAALVNAGRPELMVRPVAGSLDLQPLLSAGQILAAGPGLGLTAWSEALFEVCLAADMPLVVDADGLNLLARQKTAPARENWILTPHPAEAARLLECEIAVVQQDRVTAAQALADRYGASVVLKGCGTVIASAGGKYAICPAGNSGMATAGSGDVLTGIIAALLGQGLSCHQAAIAGAVAHAEAGDLAAQAVGEVALLAGDIIEYLPAVWMAAERPPGDAV